MHMGIWHTRQYFYVAPLVYGHGSRAFFRCLIRLQCTRIQVKHGTKTYQEGKWVGNVMMHEYGRSFLSKVGRGMVKSWATTSGTDQPLFGADLSALCDQRSVDHDLIVAVTSRNISRGYVGGVGVTQGICLRCVDTGQSAYKDSYLARPISA